MLEPAAAGVFELACTSGALGKCVRFGYPPWALAGGMSLRDVYNACIRMVRADYCGNGTPYTKDGQQIDLYDVHGIQTPENDPTMDFEAGWTPAGAACVRHVRVKENISLEFAGRRVPSPEGSSRTGLQRRHGARYGRAAVQSLTPVVRDRQNAGAASNADHIRGRQRYPRFRLACGSSPRIRVLRVRAWRGRRHGASVHGGGGGRVGGARHRKPALSISLHGKRQQAAGPAAGCACGGARGGGRSAPGVAAAAAHRGRQIVRRPDDLAGAGGCAAGRRRGARVSRLSAASRQAPVTRSREASRRRDDPDAVPARHARCARRTGRARAGVRGARSARDPEAVRNADHSFHVPARTGRKDAEVLAEMLDAFAAWTARIAGGRP